MCQSRQPHMIILRMSTPSPRREMGKQWRHPAGKRLGFTWTSSWPGPDDVPGCSPSFRCRRGGRMHHSSCFELQSRWNWPGGVERARQLGSRERVCNVSVVEDGLDELAVGTCSSPVPCWNSLNRPLVVVVSMGGALEPQDDGREGAPVRAVQCIMTCIPHASLSLSRLGASWIGYLVRIVPGRRSSDSA